MKIDHLLWTAAAWRSHPVDPFFCVCALYVLTDHHDLLPSQAQSQESHNQSYCAIMVAERACHVLVTGRRSASASSAWRGLVWSSSNDADCNIFHWRDDQ